MSVKSLSSTMTVVDSGISGCTWAGQLANPLRPPVESTGWPTVPHGEGKFLPSPSPPAPGEAAAGHLRYALPEGTPAQVRSLSLPMAAWRDIAGVRDPTGCVPAGLMPDPEVFNHWERTIPIGMNRKETARVKEDCPEEGAGEWPVPQRR